MAKRDFYDVLGIARTATEQEIRRAYRALAMQFHPDRNKAADAEAKFKEVNEAYEVLSDATKRKQYDQFGHAAFEQGGARPGGFDGFSNFEFSGFGGNFEDIFSTFFGGRQTGPRKGQDYQMQVQINFRQAMQGTSISERLERVENGKKVRAVTEIKIPAGIRHGQKIKLSNYGAPGVRGGPSGDLYVIVFIVEHKHFKRDGDDLHIEVPISAFEILSEAKVDIPTPWGKYQLAIPTNTKSGETLRIANYGAPRLTSPANRGDLFVHVQIYVPELSAKERAQVLDIARHARSKVYDRFMKDFDV